MTEMRPVPILFLAKLLAAAVLALAPVAAAAQEAEVPWSHGIAMHGDPALPADFSHLPYADPDAPRGGAITHGVQGSFDSLNQFIVQGGTTTARGIRDTDFGALVIESLLERNLDEPFTLYGLLAESVRMPEARDWIEFRLDERARFSDGTPVTVEDVIFSFEILRDKGRPHFRARYSRITAMEKTGERSVRFTFADGTDRELPLLVGMSPIFARHTIDPESFDRSTLVPPVGSGPYVIDSVDPGNRIVYRRDPDYWAKDLPIRRGLYNFDEVSIEYYRDENTLFEAFKKGLVQVLPVADPARWTTSLDFPAVAEGKVVKEGFRLGTPAGMHGFVFNTRRPVFADVRMRRALAMLFDFEWVNRTLYHGLFARTGGYFDNSVLSSLGRPASEAERALLAPFADEIAPDVLAGTWQPTHADGSGRDRKVLRAAVEQLGAAGYRIDGGTLRDPGGAPLSFEILVASQDQERLALAYQRALKLIGIEARIRSVDSAQYQRRRQTFDYDLVMNTWLVSLSPGNEQRYRWGSDAAGQDGSFNYAGVKSPAVDATIDAMLAARDAEGFTAAVRAFDRALISGAYVVPLFHLPEKWVARWTAIGRPEVQSITGPRFETWWSAAARR
ncbi:extracellular solute-binding protein [Stappia indica]|uniref:ABC transporter substrate-binding protein n=1 Tax=Stappia indica TaxID=538381 RepID=A0A857C2F1_9HYPH|nr:extracellular solute-binding protein [Stappia indica]QGZ33176.1 ABC transporter substrate-binding protein [Stappia indica]